MRSNDSILDCPKSKTELARKIATDHGSMFALPTYDSSLKDDPHFPKILRSDANVEIFAAWRSITANPRYKVISLIFPASQNLMSMICDGQDLDVNALCTEFAEKARCDGVHVVLEPQSMQSIMNRCEQKARQRAGCD